MALWILSVVIIRRRRGDDVDTSAAEVRGFGCLLAFGIPTGLIILLKSGLDFLLIPIYGFSAAWLIKQCAVESFSHEGPRPIWRPFNRHRS